MNRKACISSNLLLLFIICVPVFCDLMEIERISSKLDALIVGVKNRKNSIEDSEKNMEPWQKYEFGTGVGNREELLVTNVTTIIDNQLIDNIENYQFLDRENDFFLAGANDHVLYLYELDLFQDRSIFRARLNSSKKIRNFKLFAVPNAWQKKTDIIFVVICHESRNETDMLWYRLEGEEFIFFKTWGVQKNVESLQFFYHAGEHRLLILGEETRDRKIFSSIDMYGFTVTEKGLNFWITQGINLPKIFDIRVCPSYESTIMLLRRENDVVIYEYKGDENEEGRFFEHHNVTSNKLKNVICFESGYVHYLVTSGPEAAIFDFFESEFQHDSHSEHIFNEIGEISWIRSVPVDNYREESILLVQLKNSSVICLSWKGRGFEKTLLPNRELENIDLSKITVIPKYGFVHGNKIVKISTSLWEKPRPVRDEMEKLLRRKNALKEVLEKQELIIEETESRINRSYLMKPRVTGFWNLSKIQVNNLTVRKGVSHDEFFFAKKKMDLDDFLTDQKETISALNELESKIEEIKMNLNKSISKDSVDIILGGNLFIDGNLNVRGKMSLNNLTFDYLNGFSREEIVQEFTNYDESITIVGEKTFESIEAENLNVLFVNGIPIDEIKFDPINRDYAKVDFAKITKLKVEGNLNFSTINGIEWEKLMEKIIFKNEDAIIPGITIVEGDLVADIIEIKSLNGLAYPQDYILSKNREPVIMAGKKTFQKLRVASLDFDRISTINDLSIGEYVNLNSDTIITEEISFENVTITENLQIDGKVSGLSDFQRAAGLLLNETTDITANVIFKKLLVIDDIQVENTINGTKWSDLDDLISRENESIEINGKKIFLGQVDVKTEIDIEKRIINGHSIDEFVTLDTEQEFPNLEKILGNVTFGNLERGDLDGMKKILTQSKKSTDEPACLSKVLVFKIAPIVDRLFFKVANKNISSIDFLKSLNRTFSNVNFQNLEVTNLRSMEILPVNVNDENFEDFKRSRISVTRSQKITGDYEIENLETISLEARTIDGFTIKEIEDFRIFLDNFYHGISNGNISIGSLRAEGKTSAMSVNGKLLENFYDPATMGNVIFPDDVYVENLKVDGLVNGINFTSFAKDSVTKNNRNIVVTGKKRLEKIRCESLKASNINGKSVDFIVDPEKHQVISGFFRANSTIRVTDRFETDGKIGEIYWPEIRERFRYLGNDTYSLKGDVEFEKDDVEIEDVVVTEEIQGVNFNDFLKSVVYKNSQNLTIYGPVVFKDPVTIDSSFTITETFNDLDVKSFNDHAVRIDRPFKVESKVIFTEDIVLERDLFVVEKLRSKTIGGIDLKELYEGTVFVDRPTSIPGSVSLNNVIFDADIEVEIINDIDLMSVITLDGDQTFDGTLRCKNITVGKLEIGNSINGHNLNRIYDNTFMLTGNQNISKHVVFDGNIRMRHNFDAKLINGIDPTKMICLDGNETLTGKFVFQQPIVINGDLRTKGTINDIDLLKWEASVVTKRFPIKQIVEGTWTIYGNVHFEKNVYGSDLLDDINVTKFSDDFQTRNVHTELMIADVEKDLQSFCEDLSILKDAAEHQVYKYEFFEYLQTLNFDRKIVSLHQYESEKLDYLLINFDDCQLDIFVFAGEEFTRITSLSNAGYIERWFTMNYDGEIYFLTVGKKACGKNAGNLWKIYNDKFIHIADLGNVTDIKKIKNDGFLMIVDDRMIRRSIVEIYQRSLNAPKSYPIFSGDCKFVGGSSKVLLANRETIYEYKFENLTENRRSTNFFRTRNIFSFNVGIYEREIFIYHDDDISEEYLFITDDNLHRQKILQTIKAQKPSSIFVLDFDNLYEHFLIFVENERILQIYEYRGIEGFVYRESIRMKAEKIIPFKIRRHQKFVKKNCIAVIDDKKLVLMEARMFGEKLDMGQLPCN